MLETKGRARSFLSADSSLFGDGGWQIGFVSIPGSFCAQYKEHGAYSKVLNGILLGTEYKYLMIMCP